MTTQLRPHSIRRAEYDADKRRLVMYFIAGSYAYSDVPRERGEAIAWLSGDELRWAFDAGIEGKYKSERIGS
jgi:hypothetical protein